MVSTLVLNNVSKCIEVIEFSELLYLRARYSNQLSDIQTMVLPL